ncbi:hypothetical protein HNQ94_001385 [Salirhabdus euzebyi]|uniref:Phenylalanyl-tRNA synthetase subunit beta n=1 Tax=Salirhabdus euzebyi TaxID=394506 RepID=A0A841Q3G6_9BACI|nr:hypothetical protein [Salirhabdus euzebyi]MBB6452939.1 hypothetical protein [Salirhabdus euzebyi]
MRLIKRLIIFVVLVGAIGYGIFYFGTKAAAEKVMDYVVADLEASPELAELKTMINNSPELKSFVEEGANIDESILPFSTKEDATKALLTKFGVNEVMEMGTAVKDGLTNEEKLALLKQVEAKLSEEEMLALKVIAYKELNK